MSSGIEVLGDFPETPGVMSGGPAFQVAIYVIVSMIVLVGIVYLLGKALSNRKLEEWAKNEFLQVFISAAMVGGLFLLMAPGTGLITIAFNSLVPADPIVPSVSLGSIATIDISGCVDAKIPEDTALCYAYDYLGMLSMQILSLMTMIFSVNILLDILSKLSIDIIVVEITPLSGLSSIVQVFQSILQSLLFLGIVVEAERALLQFVNATALTLFLPVGVVLRSFFGTRRLGGALIALAVGTYLVFPLTISLNAVAVNQVATDAFQPLTDLYASVNAINPVTQFSQAGDLLSPETWTGFIEDYQQAASALVDAIAKMPQMMTTVVSLLIVQVVFLPALSIMLTMIAIKELAALFGSEINLSRFEV
jgi:hypothetical protein